MKKTLCIVFTAIFLIMSLAPSLGMLVFGESKPAANETLAPRPKITNKDGGFNASVLDDTEDYFADRFAFRKQLVTAWAEINADLLSTSVEEKVVLGKSGWLYFADTLNDYMGKSMSDEELYYAAANLALTGEYVESRGASFIFTCAPNKNSLYPQYMPSYVPAGHESSNAVKLKELLASEKVCYVDMFELFECRDEILYYHTDSHWTNRGAALAADALLAADGRESAYFSGAFSASGEHSGDLGEMLYPAKGTKETEESYVPGFSYTLRGSANGGNAMKINASREGAEGRLVCWRDSFGISLYPYLADSYASSLFLRGDVYDLSDIGEDGADTVIIELVERNLPQLVRNAPIFPAPRRDIMTEPFSGESVVCTVIEGSEGQLLGYSGLIPAEADAMTSVYILTDKGAYEACVVFDGSARRFSVYLDGGETVLGIAFYSDGVLVSRELIM